MLEVDTLCGSSLRASRIKPFCDIHVFGIRRSSARNVAKRPHSFSFRISPERARSSTFYASGVLFSIQAALSAVQAVLGCNPSVGNSIAVADASQGELIVLTKAATNHVSCCVESGYDAVFVHDFEVSCADDST